MSSCITFVQVKAQEIDFTRLFSSALLLEKRLDTSFATATTDFCESDEEFARYYKEAILIYKDSHPDYQIQITDKVFIQLH